MFSEMIGLEEVRSVRAVDPQVTELAKRQVVRKIEVHRNPFHRGQNSRPAPYRAMWSSDTFLGSHKTQMVLP